MIIAESRKSPKAFGLRHDSVARRYCECIQGSVGRRLRKAIRNVDGSFTPGVFQVFTPTEIEYIVKGTERTKELEALEKRGLTLVRISKNIGFLPAEEPEQQDASKRLRTNSLPRAMKAKAS